MAYGACSMPSWFMSKLLKFFERSQILRSIENVGGTRNGECSLEEDHSVEIFRPIRDFFTCWLLSTSFLMIPYQEDRVIRDGKKLPVACLTIIVKFSHLQPTACLLDDQAMMVGLAAPRVPVPVPGCSKLFQALSFSSWGCAGLTTSLFTHPALEICTLYSSDPQTQ